MLWCAVIPLPAFAVTPLSQGFTTTSQLPVGAIVSIDKSNAAQVQASNIDNADNIFGVVIGSSNTLLSLSSTQKNQVQVATSGVVQVLVSDLNGSVKAGDQITASPAGGVGMKATDNIKVVGVAQQDLDGSVGKSKQTYTDKSGAKHDIILGQIPVLVAISYYYKTPEKTIVPSVVQNVANAIAGKKVEALPIIVSFVIFLIAVISVGSLIYSAIRSSIISVGRNPMAQSAVYRSLLQVSMLILVIMGIAVGAIYLILTKI